ncbi:MAG: hypothetical protein HYU68_01400 [Bacteroidetes bacterium]|nr:hypothetical protein [Bacteroidota bacterium]
MKKNILAISIWLGLLASFTSCSIEPKEINYGNDHCFNCDMTVVDKTHAAQYVTKKGKAYVFDAVECLMMKLEKEKNDEPEDSEFCCHKQKDIRRRLILV